MLNAEFQNYFLIRKIISGKSLLRLSCFAYQSSLTHLVYSIDATALIAELNDYAGKFKSMTAGSGSFALEFNHDESAPAKRQSELAAQWKPKAEED